jgi:hypothetical protein
MFGSVRSMPEGTQVSASCCCEYARLYAVQGRGTLVMYASSKGCIIQGMNRTRKTFGDTSVGELLSWHQTGELTGNPLSGC